MAPVDAAQGGVVQGLHAEFKPFLPPRRSGKQSQLFGIKAVRARADRNPGQIGQAAQDVEEGGQPGGRAVGIGKGLQVGQKKGGPIRLAEMLAPVGPLSGQVHPGEAEAGA